jgi:hypothetical protein
VNDSNDGAIRYNISKARAKWHMIARVLVQEEASPRVMGMFYKVIVQLVLLYCSETWVLTLAQYDWLNAFHVTIAWRISGLKVWYDPDTETWLKPASNMALERAGLHPLATYLKRRQDYILPYARNLPDFASLRDRAVARNIVQRSFWTDDSDLSKLQEDIDRRVDYNANPVGTREFKV